MRALPLAGLPVRAGAWPAASMAGRLLADLGAGSVLDTESDCALSTRDAAVRAEPSTVQEDWQASGLAELTGRSDGPPVLPVGAPATLARAAGLALQLLSGVEVDTVSRLGERARLLGLQRNGAVSAGGGTRLLPAADGWFALSLARASDVELLPALLPGPVHEPWESLSHWAVATPVREIVDRAGELGMAVARLDETHQPGWAVNTTTASAAGGLRAAARGTLRAAARADQRPREPVVVNLASLWAGPLCAQLLALGGARVIDVESSSRPDRTPAEFHEVLRAGHALRRLDFGSVEGRAELVELIGAADVVIEASRPRALQALGADAETVRSTGGGPAVWVRITGHGQASNRTAFGDDAAVAGGLIAWDANGPMFAGDAIADPLTGILSALAATACLAAPGSWTVDVSMAGIANLASKNHTRPYEADMSVSILPDD